MAKVSLTLPTGAFANLEGTPEEITELFQFFGGEGPHTPKRIAPVRGKGAPKGQPHKPNPSGEEADQKLDLNEIITLAKDCDEAEAIEKQILDRAARVDRTLLGLYLVHEYLENAHGLTSGDVAKITRDLGISISQPNASTVLSGTASKYVIGDKVKVSGRPVRYKLSRRGVKYMKDVLAGNTGA
jgi:hypothetical protein